MTQNADENDVQLLSQVDIKVPFDEEYKQPSLEIKQDKSIDKKHKRNRTRSNHKVEEFKKEQSNIHGKDADDKVEDIEIPVEGND